MSLALLIPLFLGTITILQGAINKQVAGKLGVIQTALIGNTATLIICIVAYFWARQNEESLPPILKIKMPLTTYEWWYIFPAIFGFFIVAGMPLAISKLGAVKVTVGLVAAQMITSSLWDIFVESTPLNWQKALGILLALSSVLVIQLSK